MIFVNDKIEIDKPCKKLGYCPYGPLVEQSPLNEKRSAERDCKAFGHECPVWRNAEGFIG